MTYETVAAVSQSGTLILFIAMFLMVLGYVFGQTNRERFENAQRQALDLENSGAGSRSAD